MKEAMYDQNNCDKEYSKRLQAACKMKYEALLARAGENEKAALTREFKNEMRKARKTKLVTQIQMIFQDPIASLDPRMTVREIIAEGLVIQGERDKKVIDEKVYEMLELVGLVREHAGRYPHEFSGGQRQRIGVARAIIMNPDMIIADEPVSALDVSVQAQVINLLNELREKFGLTILFIAHDLSVVKYFSDRIGVMYFGKMVELASSEELFRNPMHPYTRSLLSAIPLPDPIYEKSRQRISYNPLAEHDYTVDKPSFREISPNHFVMCNEAEFQKYQAELK
jgi:oligopeptide transport system ATP-binding protein